MVLCAKRELGLHRQIVIWSSALTGASDLRSSIKNLAVLPLAYLTSISTLIDHEQCNGEHTKEGGGGGGANLQDLSQGLLCVRGRGQIGELWLQSGEQSLHFWNTYSRSPKEIADVSC